jgi:UPF0716 family protein affecting phage T7 exclusion
MLQINRTLLVTLIGCLCLLAVIAALLTWQVVAHEVRARRQAEDHKKLLEKLKQDEETHQREIDEENRRLLKGDPEGLRRLEEEIRKREAGSR